MPLKSELTIDVEPKTTHQGKTLNIMVSSLKLYGGLNVCVSLITVVS